MPLQIQFGAQQPAPLNLGSVPQFPGPSGASSQAIGNMMVLLQKKRAAEAKKKAIQKIDSQLGTPETRKYRSIEFSPWAGLMVEHAGDLVATRDNLVENLAFQMSGPGEKPSDEMIDLAETLANTLMMEKEERVYDTLKVSRAARMLVSEGGLSPAEAKGYIELAASGSAGEGDFASDRLKETNSLLAPFMRPPRPSTTTFNTSPNSFLDQLRASRPPQLKEFDATRNPDMLQAEGNDMMGKHHLGLNWAGTKVSYDDMGRVAFKNPSKGGEHQHRLDEAAKHINEDPVVRAAFDGWIANPNEKLTPSAFAEIGARKWTQGEAPPYMAGLLEGQSAAAPEARKPKVIPPGETNELGYGWRFTDPGPPSGQPPGKYPRGPMDPPPSERDQKIDTYMDTKRRHNDPLDWLRPYDQPR